MLSLIVAKANNNVIGNNNALIWKLPDDMARFKKITTGHIVIMGRKTFDSIGGVLPNRKNVIFTHNPDFNIDHPDVEIVHSIEEIQKYIDSPEEAIVIGGAMIYSLLLPYVEKLYITEIDQDFKGDAVFPVIEDLEEKWTITERQERYDESQKITYRFLTYIKNK
jgi:dihydrofolate reductase